MENKNKTKTVIVIVLVAIVLILVGYFVYDKFINNPEKQETENEKSEEKIKLTKFYFGMCKEENGEVSTCKSEIKSDITNYYFHYNCKTANCSASADSEIIYIVDNDEQKYKVSINVASDKLPFLKIGDEINVSYVVQTDVIEIKSIE